MLQYWINKDGEQTGPFSYDELKQQPIDADTWVWCSGMDDWKKIVDVPELSALAQQPAAAEPEAQPTESAEPAAAEPESAEAQPAEPAPAAEAQPAEPDSAEPEPEQQPEAEWQEPESEPAAEPEEPTPPAYTEPAAQYAQEPQEAQACPPGFQPQYQQPAYQYQQPAYQQPQHQQQPVQQPAEQECPPTNLVWAIISTVLCCAPLGIVAIVLAANVKPKWRIGDYAKARKYSDWSAWLCIAAITLGVLFMPFSMLSLLG